MNLSHSTTYPHHCKHFSLTERKEIASALSRGFSIRAIARALGRAPSSVSREIKRNSSSVKKYKKGIKSALAMIPMIRTAL